MKPRIRLVRLNSLIALTLAVGCSLSSPQSFAGTLYWDANGSTAGAGTPAAGNWDSGTNWSSNAAGSVATTSWLNGEAAIFSAGTEEAGTWNITLAGTIQTNSITFNGTANTIHNLTGGTINMGASPLTITSSAAGGVSGRSKTIATKITGSGGLTLAVNGDISPTGNGSNTLFALTGANDFTGGVTINSGAVDARSVFGAASNLITLNGGGFVAPVNGTIANNLQIGPAGGVFRPYGAVTDFRLTGSVSGSGAIGHSDGGTVVFAGDLSGYSGPITNPTGSLTFANTASPTGSITVTAGSISVGENGTVGALGAAASATLKTGTSLYVRRTDTVSATQVLPATVTLEAGSNFEVNPNVSTAVLNLDRDLGALPVLPTDPIPGQIRISGGTVKLATGTDVAAGTIGLALQSNTNRGVLEVGPGSTLVTQSLDIGAGASNSGTINQTGGTVTLRSGGFFRIGHWNNNANAGSNYNLTGGTLDATALSANTGEERMVNIGWDGQGDMVVGGGSGPATLKAFGVQLDGKGNNGTGGNMTLTVATNGTVEVGGGGLGSAAAGDKLTLGGGTLKATAVSPWNAFIETAAATTSSIDVNGNVVTLPLANLSGTGTVNLPSAVGSLVLDAGADPRTLNQVLTGSTNITKTGTGRLTLGGTNSLSGTVLVSAGELKLSATLGSGVLSAAAGTTVSGEGSAGSLILAGATLAADPTTPGAFTTAGGVTLTGTNYVTFSKAAPVGISAVTILNHGGALGGTVGTNIALANLASYRSASLSDNGSALVANLNVRELVWSGTGGTTWDVGTSTNWTSSGASSFYSMDRVLFDNSGPAGTITLSGALSPGLVTVNSSGDYTFSGTGSLAGAASLVKSGTGTLTVSTANTFEGTTQVTGGTLKLGSAAALGSGAGGTVIESGGTLDINGQDLGTGSEVVTVSGTGVGGNGALINSTTTRGVIRHVALAGDATVNIATGNSLVIGQNLGNAAMQGSLTLGANTLTKNGPGELMLNGVAVTSGNITVNGGTLALMRGYTTAAGEVNSGQQPVTLGGTGTLTINPGAVVTTNRWASALTLSMPIVLNGGSLLSTWPGPNGINITSPVNVTANSTIGFGGGYGNATFSGIITGSGKLTFTGGELVNLTGANNYTGGTSLNSGQVSFTNGALGTGLVTMNGGNLVWGGTNTQDISPQLVMVAAKTATFNTGANAVTFASPIGSSVAANLLKSGSGTLRLSGGVTYAGTTTVQEGSLILSGAANPLPAATAALTLGGATTAGKLVLENTSQTLISLGTVGSGASAIVGGGTGISVLTLDTAVNATIEAGLGGNGTNENNLSFVKTGAGVVRLKGTNSLTGNTEVNAGGLHITGGLPDSPVLVAAAGTLSGSGTLKSLSVITGGTVAPGDLPPSAKDQLVRTATSGTTVTVTTTADFQELHNTTGTVIPNNTTYTYTGEIYLPGAAGVVYYFGENFDDSIALKIGSTNVLAANGYATIGTGSFTSTGPGWYPISLVAVQGGGGVGPTTAGGWAVGKGVGFSTTLPATLADGNLYQAFTYDNLTAAGIKIRSGVPTNTFAVANGAAFGGTFACDLDGPLSDKLAVTGDLNLAGATLAVSTLAGGATEPLYVIATYTGQLSGSFENVTGLPTGYVVSYNTIAKQIELKQFPGYQTWLEGYPDLLDTTLEGDPDEDGIKNILEYVLAGNPTLPNRTILPTQARVGTNLVVSYKRTKRSAGDILQTVQWSTNLATWNDVIIPQSTSGLVTVTDNLNDTENVTVTIPMNGATKMFVRLKAKK